MPNPWLTAYSTVSLLCVTREYSVDVKTKNINNFNISFKYFLSECYIYCFWVYSMTDNTNIETFYHQSMYLNKN